MLPRISVRYQFIATTLCLTLFSGCEKQKTPAPAAPGSYGTSNGGYSGYGSYDNGYGSSEIKFLDELDSQAAPEVGLYDLAFTKADGKQTAVREFGNGKSVVLVVTRGNTIPICPYCSTQTANYIREYEKFQKRNTEVVLVYPVEASKDQENLKTFLEDAKGRLDDPGRTVPFPVVFDVELTAVDRLGIRKDLSKPATYLISPEGEVQFAYVGSHWGDRPSTKKILERLDELAPQIEAPKSTPDESAGES